MEPCNGPIITLAGLKGGVGRTMAAVNLAALFALIGRRTLLVDLDPMGNASLALGATRCDSGCPLGTFTEAEAFRRRIVAIPKVERLSLWPGGSALNELEDQLGSCEDKRRDQRLRGILEELCGSYDAIFVDAPPGHGPLARNALSAANVMLLPLDDGAFMGSSLEDTIERAQRLHEGREGIRAFGLAIGSSATTPSFQLPSSCEGKLSILDNGITYEYPAVTGAARAGLPLILHAPEARVTRSYVELCRELMAKLGVPTTAPNPAPEPGT